MPLAAQGNACINQSLSTQHNGFPNSLAAAQFIPPAQGYCGLDPASPAVGAGFDLGGVVDTDIHDAARSVPSRHGAIAYGDAIFTDGFEWVRHRIRLNRRVGEPGARQGRMVHEQRRHGDSLC
ncbi:MAG: hypothetical protein WBP53_02000 [Dokdonella sp.]